MRQVVSQICAEKLFSTRRNMIIPKETRQESSCIEHDKQ